MTINFNIKIEIIIIKVKIKKILYKNTRLIQIKFLKIKENHTNAKIIIVTIHIILILTDNLRQHNSKLVKNLYKKINLNNKLIITTNNTWLLKEEVVFSIETKKI